MSATSLLEKIKQDRQEKRLAHEIWDCLEQIKSGHSGRFQFYDSTTIYCCRSSQHYCSLQVDSGKALKECAAQELYKELIRK